MKCGQNAVIFISTPLKPLLYQRSANDLHHPRHEPL